MPSASTARRSPRPGSWANRSRRCRSPISAWCASSARHAGRSRSGVDVIRSPRARTVDRAAPDSHYAPDHMDAEREKQLAAEEAAALVEDGMTVGLGTGTTVAHLLPALAARRLDLR